MSSAENFTQSAKCYLLKNCKVHYESIMIYEKHYQVHYYIYIIFLAYLGDNFTLQAALRAGGLYLNSLRAATSSQHNSSSV